MTATAGPVHPVPVGTADPAHAGEGKPVLAARVAECAHALAVAWERREGAA